MSQTTSRSWSLASVLLWRSSARLSLVNRSISISTVMTKGKIPDRWDEYEPMGKVVAGTRFIAFKVPLNPVISRSLPPDVKSFMPEDLLTFIRKEDRELGIVIDLTNTTRYYRKEDIVNQKIEYVKIFTAGHMVPSSTVQNCFFKTVDDFLSSNKDNDRVIGVHCTHGLNRTGYLVCRYMIDRMNFKADDAITAFNEARGYDMERQNYLSDLRGEPTSDVPSPNKDRRLERKRTRQSRANDQWSHGHNRARNSHNSYDGNGSYHNRGYHGNYRKNYGQHSYDNYQNDWYDSARQPRGYDRQDYEAYQNSYASNASWRKPRDYNQDGYDFAANDTNFGGASFYHHGGQQFQGWGQRDSRPQYAQHGRNREADRNTGHSDRYYQRSDSKQWRGNDHS